MTEKILLCFEERRMMTLVLHCIGERRGMSVIGRERERGR